MKTAFFFLSRLYSCDLSIDETENNLKFLFSFLHFLFQLQFEKPHIRERPPEERKRLYLRPTYLTEAPDTGYDTGT